jgi:hypothetical protein
LYISSLTDLTPGVVSAATRKAALCSSELTGPRISATPSLTVTVRSQGIPPGAAFIRPRICSLVARSSPAAGQFPPGSRAGERLKKIRPAHDPHEPAITNDGDALDPVLFEKSRNLAEGGILSRRDQAPCHHVLDRDRIRLHVIRGPCLL